MRPRLEQRACPCGGGDGRLPSRPPSQPAQTPTSAAPASSSPLIDRQFEVSALSGGSVGRLCGSGGRVWSGDRSPSLVCVFSGRLCVLGLWILLGLETGLFVSRGLFVSVCPPGTSARFGNVPGAGAFGGFDSPAGLRLRLLLLLARDVQSAVPSLRSSVVYAPYRRRSECAVCCFRCLWVWGILVALIRLVGFLVGLRLRASPSGFAFGLRLRASPSGPPEATTRLMAHGRCPGSFSDSPKNTHGTSRSYLPRNTAVRRFGAFPALLVAIHLREELSGWGRRLFVHVWHQFMDQWMSFGDRERSDRALLAELWRVFPPQLNEPALPAVKPRQ